MDDAAGLAAAIAGGADRIELCAALALGGLTPGPGLIRIAAAAPAPVRAMVRPHARSMRLGLGDLETMTHDISAIRAAGLEGVVLGATGVDGRLDASALAQLRDTASGLGATLHRAFDVTPDIAEDVEAAVETAIALGFDCVLTSGRAADAPSGAALIARARARAAGRIEIMAGAGVTAGNVNALLRAGPVDWVHASCAAPCPPDGGAAEMLGLVEARPRRTDAETVRALRRAMEEARAG